MILRPYSRSCRTASIRSGIAGGLAGEVSGGTEPLSTPATWPKRARGRDPPFKARNATVFYVFAR
jgi:hypothetical protein